MRTTPLYKFWKHFVAFIMRVMFDQKSYGIEHVPRKGGVLVVSNHVSYLDPCIIAAISPRQFAFLADSGLWTFKPFGWMISRLNAFPVTQGKGDIGAMKKTIALLNDGWALTVFPEGMRSPTGEMMPVQAGAALIIRRTNVPVVPAYIYGAYEAWPRHRLFPRRGHVKVIYRPAMDMSALGAKEITAELTRVFAEMEAEAKARFGRPVRA
jgi:1-acyl-sn-glycerol-3-phosphate acyltransferase